MSANIDLRPHYQSKNKNSPNNRKEPKPMKLVRYQHPLSESFGEFDRWLRSPSDGFHRLFELADRLSGPAQSGVSGYGVDLFEDDDHYYARLELPGVKKDDLTVELHDHQLSISYERRSDSNDDEKNREQAAAKRVFTVPEGINPDKVSAKLEDGILTVTLPKSEERKPREIKVS
jgi:HSP20 family protein